MLADILIVEDEKNISNLIEMALSRHGHKTDCVFDGESCADVLEKKHFDLILLDVMLPKISGFELMDYIKGFDTPVIFITAKSDISDRVYGLNLGADDYITKPFSSRELLARIKRITKKLDKTMAMNFGDISIDFDKKQVCKNGNPIVLTALEYRLFAMLAKNSGKVLTREQILERIWDLSGNYVEDNTLTVYIKRLRKKLDTNMIKTVKGLGYRLEV